MVVKFWVGNFETGACFWRRSHFLTWVVAYGWLIVALGMSSMSQRLAAWMVSAYSIMELCQYILSMLVSKAFKIGPNQGPHI